MTEEMRSAVAKSDGLGWLLLIMAGTFMCGLVWGVCLANAHDNKVLYDQAVQVELNKFSKYTSDGWDIPYRH